MTDVQHSTLESDDVADRENDSGDNEARLKRLIDLGIALSAERDHNRLIERILLEAKDLYDADGGTLYLMKDGALNFEIMLNDTMNIAMGGTTGVEIPFPPLALHDEDGNPNHKNVASHVALSREIVNIADAYEVDRFDFSGAKKFDASTGFRSQSFLTVPMTNYEGDVLGVLQLINAREGGEVVPFGTGRQALIEALASQAAVASDNQMLIDAQRELLESFIKLIAGAIDAKSPYTGGHCQRVPVITEMLAQAACVAEDGPYETFSLSEEELYELSIAAWLHDCGKVTTPEYVVDKSTKLETIYDRVETVRTRFEVAKRDAEIDYLRALQADDTDADGLKETFEARVAKLNDDWSFLEVANIGGEFMSDDHQARIHEIAAMTWSNNGETENFLSENEVYNLCIARGTLTAEEREVINNHIVMTVEMLEELPFPKHLKKVPEYAGGHHEKMDGTGYPKGLTADQMSIPARMMAIADIFEALTASDRPYKKAKTISESLKIMGFMVKDAHIDPDLFRLFLQADIPRIYAEANLLPDQIDTWDPADYLN
ncbi:MAG: GAF domain-containing protein [Alphaproteobacteria bacterium]|mgnify:FL=1|jgi:HD-GYP domain-containing protein (c-di-GMP phosphodiesterase class II)|nr:GAF domain-containing protein [Alphaproteobacteria bacterium]MBT5161904.1 GAF domain-containing protein [Alphaproteobacteria bacterium]MBT7746140.1 GAF domain-containing protein [Alphaproteobacteria bacterium]